MESRDISESPEDIFIADSRTRSSGSTYSFQSTIPTRHGQHGLTHAAIMSVGMTNDFFNIRSGNNVINISLNDGTTTSNGSITLTPGRYNTISHVLAAATSLATAYAASVNSQLAITFSKDVYVTYDTYKTKIVLTKGTETLPWNISLSQGASIKSDVVNDASKILGFILPSSLSAAANAVQAGISIISPHYYDVNHIKDVKIFNDLGHGRHSGCVEVLHLSESVSQGYCVHRNHDVLGRAFKIGSRNVSTMNTFATDIHGVLLEGNGEFKLTYQMFKTPVLSSYGKRIRIR